MKQSRRRDFLRAAVGSGVIVLSGCSALSGSGSDAVDPAVPENTDLGVQDDGSEETEPDFGPVYRADFESESSDETITIEHVGGDPIPADQLLIRSSDAEVRWHELGTTDLSAGGTITRGDTASIGPSVQNWPADIDQSKLIQVVFVNSEGLQILLATFETDERVGEPAGETAQEAETVADSETVVETETTNEPDAVVDSETAVPLATDTTAAPAGDTLFREEFADDFTDGWRYQDGALQSESSVEVREGVLAHEAPFKYGSGYSGNIVTRESFKSPGKIRVSARIRTVAPEYVGYGFGLVFSNHNTAWLKNNLWQGFDRFGVFGVEDRPPEYASDDGGYREQTHVAKLGPATTTTEFVTYSMTVDVSLGEVVTVRRGGETYIPVVDIGEPTESFRLLIGGDSGHEIEVDYVEVASLSDE
jgi:hypothetical protein